MLLKATKKLNVYKIVNKIALPIFLFSNKYKTIIIL